ncbi:hypothetical protein CYMTET_7372 [Cymbomonas tetramitiformis]|uniref:Uncharacterized protein n=1 Tax=Cymbomonas tetramitiformis TaxID=36881 RepID=A0AAE0GVT9_9CHLO|nr:hypothetical protein CYMTET_7372 [Cymbomonas tetramitiformis]
MPPHHLPEPAPLAWSPLRRARTDWGPYPTRARWEAFQMLPRERREQAAQHHAEELEPEWEEEAYCLWKTGQALRLQEQRRSRGANHKRSRRVSEPVLAAPIDAETGQGKDGYSCFRKEAPAAAATPSDERNSGADDKVKQHGGETKEAKPDEEDAEVPQWILDELVKLKQRYQDVATAREGLKEVGYVDPNTDQPVSAEEGRRAAGAKGKPEEEENVVAGLKKVVEEEDPTSPLDLELSSSDEEEVPTGQ